MATLLLLNGLPAVGKTTLARRFVADRPLALCVDIDALRTSLGGWESDPRSKEIARELAVVLAAAHLRAGHDVVVPQLLGRLPFVERLEATASDAGAAFVEVLVTADVEVVARRVLARRRAQVDAGAPHPAAELTDADPMARLAETAASLERVASARPGTLCVDVGTGDPEAAYRALVRALAGAK